MKYDLLFAHYHPIRGRKHLWRPHTPRHVCECVSRSARAVSRGGLPAAPARGGPRSRAPAAGGVGGQGGSVSSVRVGVEKPHSPTQSQRIFSRTIPSANTPPIFQVTRFLPSKNFYVVQRRHALPFHRAALLACLC